MAQSFDDDDLEAQRKRAASAPEFTADTIAADRWTAVYFGIPVNCDARLSRQAYDAAMQCAGAVAGPPSPLDHPFAPETVGADKSREENFEHAVRRLDELDSRLRPAILDEDAARQAAPEQSQEGEREQAAEKEPMTVEAIERDPWAAVDRDIPADASRELLSLIVTTGYELRGVEREGQEDLEVDPAEERHKEALDALHMLDMREAAAAPEFSRDTIEADWWTAVYSPIPQAADPALLAHAREVAGRVREGLELDGQPAGFSVYEPFVIGSEYTRAENIEHASARIAELDERLELARAQETAAEKDHSKEELLEREPLAGRGETLEEMEERHWDEYELVHGAYGVEELPSQLAARHAEERGRFNTTAPLDPGDDISRPLGAAELAERVRRIIENPSLADAERDDRVLQVVDERREELGLVEAAKADDVREVESSQEPEPEATADRDAAEIDYLFGKEEMTEARAAAYDKFTGQELSPRAGQTAGAVQDVGQSQSQSQSHGRSR